jgi:lysine biosynthesis protein LysW
MKTTHCPVCNSDVIIADEAYEGDLVDCAICGAELEIASLHPLQLAENKSDEPAIAESGE